MNSNPSAINEGLPGAPREGHCFSSSSVNDGTYHGEIIDRTTHTPSPRRHELMRIFYTQLVHQKLIDMNVKCACFPICESSDISIRVLHSAGLFTHPGPTIFVIQAGGVARAGVWAPRLLMRPEQGLLIGSQQKLIQEAQAAGFSIAIINANEVVTACKSKCTEKIKPTTLLNTPTESSNSNCQPTMIPSTDIGKSSLEKDNTTFDKCIPNGNDESAKVCASCSSKTAETATETASAADDTSQFKVEYANIKEFYPWCNICIEERLYAVWRQIIPLCVSKHIFVWAHQYGVAGFLYPLRPFPSIHHTGFTMLSSTLLNGDIVNPEKSDLPSSKKLDPVVIPCDLSEKSIEKQKESVILPSFGLPGRRRHASAAAILMTIQPVATHKRSSTSEISKLTTLDTFADTSPSMNHPILEDKTDSNEFNFIAKIPRLDQTLSSNLEQNKLQQNNKDYDSNQHVQSDNDRFQTAWNHRALEYWHDIQDRVRGIVFTDAANASNLPLQKVGWGLVDSKEISKLHGNKLPKEVAELRRWFNANALQFITANAPLGTRIEFNKYQDNGIASLSAGTSEHELIPHTVTTAAITFFVNKMRNLTNPTTSTNC